MLDGLIYGVRFVLLMAILLGFMLSIGRYARVKAAFCPAVALSCAALVVFVGGMAGLLLPVCVVLAVFGVALFGFFLATSKGRAETRRFVFQRSIIFFLVVSFFQAFLFSNATLGHYDDFSHWGTIVKDMFSHQALPGEGSQVDRIGLFMNYPPVSACFVYLANLLIGYTEGHAIVAQNVLMVSAASALLVGGDGKSKGFEGFVYAAMGILSFFVIVNDNGLGQFQSLLVDTVMGLMVVAALLIVLVERECVWKAALVSLPVALFFSMVKDNGKVYFVLLATCLAFLAWRDPLRGSGEHGRRRVVRIVSVVVPCLGLLVLSAAWKVHVDSAYAAGYAASKFAVSLDTLVSGDWGYALSVPGRVFKEAFCVDLTRSAVFFGLNIVVVLYAVFCRARGFSRRILLACCVLANASILLTCMALVVLYSFVMPPEESVGELAGFSRYYGTALLVFFCMQMWGLATQVFLNSEGSVNERRRAKGISVALTLFGAILLVPNFVAFARGMGGEHMGASGLAPARYDSRRAPISSVLSCASETVPPGQTTAVYYGPDIVAGYYWFLSLYELQGAVSAVSGDSLDAVQKVSEADWVAIVGNGGHDFLQKLIDEGVWVEGDEGSRLFRVNCESGCVTLVAVACADATA